LRQQRKTELTKTSKNNFLIDEKEEKNYNINYEKEDLEEYRDQLLFYDTLKLRPNFPQEYKDINKFKS
jgi:hypothetical protein